MSCKHRNVHCPDRRGPLGEYIRATALACKVCGSGSEILPLLASTYQREGLWEKGRAGGGFPAGGRVWHTSPGVHMSARGLLWTLPQQGWAQGVFLGMLHPWAGTCLKGAGTLCSAPLGDFPMPGPGKGVQPLPPSRGIRPQPGGRHRGVPPSPHLPLSDHVSIP